MRCCKHCQITAPLTHVDTTSVESVFCVLGRGMHAVQENYGRSNEEAVQKVKALYKELNLEELFKDYEAQSHGKLLDKIHKQEVLPPAVFTMLLNKIYKRTK